jgi:ABC-2 type transport system permease protein
VRTQITRLDVTRKRRSLLAYSVGMAVYTLIVVALYPAFKDSASLDRFIHDDPTGAALFGVTGTISSSDGWLNGNIYANFLPLVMLLVTVAYGAAALAGQDEDGTLCLIATLPIRRDAVVMEKAAAMAVQAVILAAAVAACAAVGHWFDLTTRLGNIVASTLAVAALGVDLGLIAMAVGALTGRRGTAIAVAATVAATSYLVSSLAPVVSWIRPAKYLSLFYWSVGDDQITTGVTIGDCAVMLAVGLCALYAAVRAFRGLDLH